MPCMRRIATHQQDVTSQTRAVRASTAVLISIYLLLTSHTATAAIKTPASTITAWSSERTLRGALQALIGHQQHQPTTTTASPQDQSQPLRQRLYLQTPDGRVYELDLPRHLAEGFDAAASAGSEVEVRFLYFLSEEEALAAGAPAATAAAATGSNLTRSSSTATAAPHAPLQLVQAPTLLSPQQPDKLLIIDSAVNHGQQQQPLHRHRALRQASSEIGGSGPQGPVTMIVYIMDLSACGTAVPVTTPEARGVWEQQPPRHATKPQTTVEGRALSILYSLYLVHRPILAPLYEAPLPPSSPPPPIRPS